MEYKESNPCINVPTKQSELIIALEQFRKQNDYTDDVSASIKERLRSILKWEKPNDRSMDKVPEMTVNCAVDEFNLQLRRQSELNERLSDILLHLKEII